MVSDFKHFRQNSISNFIQIFPSSHRYTLDVIITAGICCIASNILFIHVVRCFINVSLKFDGFITTQENQTIKSKLILNKQPASLLTLLKEKLQNS